MFIIDFLFRYFVIIGEVWKIKNGRVERRKEFRGQKMLNKWFRDVLFLSIQLCDILKFFIVQVFVCWIFYYFQLKGF